MEMKGEKIDSEKLLSYSNWQLIRDIGSYLKPYRWRFFSRHSSGFTSCGTNKSFDIITLMNY
ncbi:MAG: hypothetical protein WC715_05120 [Patescibacteria group bacterium]|jgi:hypothetical protein